MTELIVALDGPNTYRFRTLLHSQADVQWFKLGPQAIADPNWSSLLRSKEGKTFLDLKLADTEDTVKESIKRFADIGIAAVSVFTDQATYAATSFKHDIKIWRLLHLTDDVRYFNPGYEYLGPVAGVILPSRAIKWYGEAIHNYEIISPGIRFQDDAKNGHVYTTSPYQCKFIGINYAVVGRPIWQAKDPISEAKKYIEALK